eukprot:gnl/TRDRNA2_/TRDRNA2_189531_c0_seq1.p1 gnl/TRDRNA2_/TRDRNA2_189531_c0~~gnl/TRDRNA2_/TRDRNA2_189531_c0_seq1.p1  ORF type:complete len:475 (-),score=92.32 gnl/TRDRNA2_/TRDRNA2_189531_c0_seq1:96-1520(-)
MTLSVEPPFELHPPAPDSTSGCWRLVVDLGTYSAESVDCDLASDEVRVSFLGGGADSCAAQRHLCCRLPPGAPRIDVGSAATSCRFSRRQKVLSVSWQGIVPGAPPVGFGSEASDAADLSAESLDSRIAALREECQRASARMAPPASSTAPPRSAADQLDNPSSDDIKLFKTVAAQVSRLFAKSTEAGGQPEHLASVVDMALEMSGKATNACERARLVMGVGEAVDPSATGLRERCLARAVELLEQAAEEDSGGGLPKVDILYLLGVAQDRLGWAKHAEKSLRAALDALGSRKSQEAEVLRARIYRVLAEACAQQSHTGEARGHLEAAGDLLKCVRDREIAEAAARAESFAAPSDAERLPIRRYAVMDDERQATVRVNLDEAIFPGAARLVGDRLGRHIQVAFDDGSRTAMELRVAAPKEPDGTELACWVLRLSPLRHPVVPDATVVRLRKNGTVSLVLRKEDALLWSQGLLRE